MYSYAKVSSAEATQLIHEVVSQVQKNNQQIAVTVGGPEGDLMAFFRMDGANPAASRIAHNKAYTDTCDRKDTKAMGEFMHDCNGPPAFWGDKKIAGFGGGVTIWKDNRVIGGIGVRLSEENDERIAYTAIKAVYRS